MKNLEYNPASLYFYQNSLEEIDALIEGCSRSSAVRFERDSSSKPKHTIQDSDMYISFKNSNVYQKRNVLINSGISEDVLRKRGKFFLSRFLIETQFHFRDSINRMKNFINRKAH